MTQQFRTPPNVREGVVEGFRTAPWWYRYIQALDTGQAPSAESVIALTASPFTFTAPRGGFVIIQGGSVGSVQFKRSTNFYYTGAVSGTYPVSQGDQLKITYTTAPNFTFFPT